MIKTIDFAEQLDGNVGMMAPDRERKGAPAVFSFSTTLSGQKNDGEVLSIDSRHIDNRATFMQNYRYWNESTRMMSVENFDSPYFNELVRMGKDALPFIYEGLHRGQDDLVCVLDKIFPGVMKYDGFVTLKEARKKWLWTLKKIGIA